MSRRLIPLSEVINSRVVSKRDKALFDTVGEKIREENTEALISELALELKNARRQIGMTQRELASRVGTKRENISRMESGKQNMSIGFLVKISAALGKKLTITV